MGGKKEEISEPVDYFLAALYLKHTHHTEALFNIED